MYCLGKNHSASVIESCLRVIDCDVNDRLDLPELTSIQMGLNTFRFKTDSVDSTLTMKNLPKLTTLTTVIGSSTNECFGYPRYLTLESD